jgi:hypothetical protein
MEPTDPAPSSESPDTPSLIAPSLRAFLHDIVDYAGLFPPSDLPLQEALENYAEYRREPESWILSRFVLPVRRLPDLTPHQHLFKHGDPFLFSVLGTGGRTPDAFLDAFRRDLDVIDTFDDHHAGRTQVQVMEGLLPPSLLESADADVAAFFDRVDRALVTTGTAQLDLFFEIPLDEETLAHLPPLCAAIAEFNSRQPVPPRCEIGLKIRCGGRTPEDIPPARSIARVICACRDAGISFKATAGLHHPVRHYDDSMEKDRHGFFNLFGAAVLAQELHLSETDVQAILLDDVEDNFQFLKEEFGWRDLRAHVDGVEHTRDSLATTFGSCSFTDPIHDLRDLDLI